MSKELKQLHTDKLNALKERQQALRAAIAHENQLQQKRDARNHSKLIVIIGETVIGYARRSPEFDLVLRSALKDALEPRDRKFLTDLGWL